MRSLVLLVLNGAMKPTAVHARADGQATPISWLGSLFDGLGVLTGDQVWPFQDQIRLWIVPFAPRE